MYLLRTRSDVCVRIDISIILQNVGRFVGLFRSDGRTPWPIDFHEILDSLDIFIKPHQPDVLLWASSTVHRNTDDGNMGPNESGVIYFYSKSYARITSTLKERALYASSTGNSRESKSTKQICFVEIS